MKGPDVYGLVADRATGNGRADSGLWDRLAQLLDPNRYRPKLADDVEIREFPLKWGNDYVMVANTRDLVHYRLTADQLPLLQRMDGSRTVKEIVLEEFEDSGDLDPDAVTDLVRTLYEGNFLDQRYRDVDQLVTRALDPVTERRRKARIFAKSLTIEWKSAHEVVRWLYDHGLKYAFLKPLVALQAIVAVAGIAAFISLVASGDFTIGAASLAASFIVLWILDYFSVLVHELGHALVLVRNGRRIKSAGFMIYFGSPAFFVESSDSLMMDRRQQILSSFAGPYAETVFASLSALIVWWFPDWFLSQTLFVAAALNYYLVLMNLIPLLELDGYYILADVIQVPDLRPRSLGFLRDDLFRKVLHRERFTKQEVGLALYGIIGVAFTIFALYSSYRYWNTIFGPLIEGLWDGGSLTRLLLLALAVIVIGPMIRGLIALLRVVARRIRTLIRRVRFRLETRWRVEAAELIDRLPMFDEVPVDVLNDLAGRVRLRTLAPNQPVFRQGDRPTGFYVVRSGMLEVVEEDPETGQERQIRTLVRGDSFGELGLLMDAPRAATIRSLEAAEVFEIDQGTFDHLLADMIHVPDFEPTLQQLAELRQQPCFAHLTSDQLVELRGQGEWLVVAPGQAVVRQGEEGDSFYAVSSGQFDIVTDGELKQTVGPGSYFGEIALLLDVPRTASVIARTPARVFRLDRSGFDLLLAGSFRRGTLDPTIPVSQIMTH
ncbi:MAG TPA: cyclic nucleotide-binding domain-containing protein [Actinomycetota bacterium]|nr:cyclic nucleotide-binding domain-containing protein [Actinomycetota bacterium]